MAGVLRAAGWDGKGLKLLQFSSGPHALSPNAAGDTIPYFNPATGKTKFYRVRYVGNGLGWLCSLVLRKHKGIPNPLPTSTGLYMPPYIGCGGYFKGLVPWSLLGWKESAFATKRWFPDLWLGAVWCFMSKKAGLSLLLVFGGVKLATALSLFASGSGAAANLDISDCWACPPKGLWDAGLSSLFAASLQMATQSRARWLSKGPRRWSFSREESWANLSFFGKRSPAWHGILSLYLKGHSHGSWLWKWNAVSAMGVRAALPQQLVVGNGRYQSTRRGQGHKGGMPPKPGWALPHGAQVNYLCPRWAACHLPTWAWTRGAWCQALCLGHQALAWTAG